MTATGIVLVLLGCSMDGLNSSYGTNIPVRLIIAIHLSGVLLVVIGLITWVWRVMP